MKTGEKIAALRRKAAELPGGDKKPLVIVALGVIGMLCLLLSSGSSKAEKTEDAPDIAATQAAVERRLEALLKTVDGVGKVKVCVTVDRMQRMVYAVDTEQTGGENRSEKSEKYVFTESGNNTQGLVLAGDQGRGGVLRGRRFRRDPAGGDKACGSRAGRSRQQDLGNENAVMTRRRSQPAIPYEKELFLCMF